MIEIIIGICVGAVVLAIIFWMVTNGRFYKRIFSPEHIVEFAQSLANVKNAAFEKMGQLPGDINLEDSRRFLTTAGLALFYTIDRDNDQEDGATGDEDVQRKTELYRHHFSISLAGRHTPHAVGETFIVYVAKLLNIDPDRFEVGVSPSNIFHCVFKLDEPEQAEFNHQNVAVPSIEAAQKMHEQCVEQRDQLRCERFDM